MEPEITFLRSKLAHKNLYFGFFLNCIMEIRDPLVVYDKKEPKRPRALEHVTDSASTQPADDAIGEKKRANRLRDR